MNYINRRAEKLAQRFILGQVIEHEQVIEEVKSEIYNIEDNADKITFLRVILEQNAREHQNHLQICTTKNDCPTSYDHESIEYFLTQELNRLGIRTNNDQFSIEERDEAESKLDKILSDLQTLKNGQEIIYDDLKSELDSLKELFFLGKKTWVQLLLGKTGEMVISGIITETISKSIVSTIKDASKLLS